jgi:hypothetical protein
MDIEKPCGISGSFESRHFSGTNYECEVAGIQTRNIRRERNRAFSQWL